MHDPAYTELRARSPGYWMLLAGLLLLILAGLAAAHHMDVEGHRVTGMNNQIVWGLPHVFAIFLILAASGALNLASLASVFGKREYVPLARFSAVLALALLLGGLLILVLDLGRPDRLIIAMTHYNFRSIFAWNVILYIGFAAIVLVYLWLMMERRLQAYAKPVGLLAFVWRLILTTGTGSIFGFLVARDAYDSALLAPMFIVLSLLIGLAVSIPMLLLSCRFGRRAVDASQIERLRSLLGLFIASILYLVVLFHLTKLYDARQYAIERFILLEGGIFTFLFWVMQMGLGYLAPLALCYLRRFRQSTPALLGASLLVIIGALSQLYVIIIAGQAYPLEIFPGYRVESNFQDGAIVPYSPSLWELLLGMGGLASALLLVLLALRVLPILPERLAPEAN